MYKKFSIAVLLLLALGVFLNLCWAEKSTQEKKQGYLGVYLQELTPELKESLDLDKSTEGVLASGVVEDSPAEEAGIEDEDVIISFNGKRVYSVDNLTRLVRKTPPGTKIELKVIREGEKKTLEVTLGETSSSTLYSWGPDKFKQEQKKVLPFRWSSYSGLRMGILVQDLTPQLGEYFGVKDAEGVLVIEVEKGSPADKAGFKAGDVILKVDNQKVKNSEDILETLSDKEKGDEVNLSILREKRPMDFSLTLEEKEEEWSLKMLPDIEKLKKIEILPEEELKLPELKLFEKEYSSEERNLKRELKDLKNELEKLKEELEELRKEIR